VDKDFGPGMTIEEPMEIDPIQDVEYGFDLSKKALSLAGNFRSATFGMMFVVAIVNIRLCKKCW
jgi:hypothetical protein